MQILWEICHTSLLEFPPEVKGRVMVTRSCIQSLDRRLLVFKNPDRETSPIRSSQPIWDMRPRRSRRRIGGDEIQGEKLLAWGRFGEREEGHNRWFPPGTAAP
ncbi:hypothetical protein CR513_50252, partial [Mucuna pruriens]